ncbi:MAG: hypothetical protein K0R18_518 [Bacillales bacterium]|jgi:hypothetical protein|nr:hypothetical protein [Bacillales bacterium]
MKLVIDKIEFLLDDAKEDIAQNLSDEFDNIKLLAIMVGYDITCAYNSSDMQMHCYFKKNHDHKYTLTIHRNKHSQFTQYSIYSSNDKFPIIYRKKNSPSFWRVLNNFKRML